jgi:hypothetical protein
MDSTNPVITGELTENNTWISGPITGVTREAIWARCVEKMKNTTEYLPVTDLKVKENEDGSIWRSMSFNGKVIDEDIYFDEPNGLITCYCLDDQGKRTPMVHYNKLIQDGDTFRLEYWAEDTSNGTKTPLKATGAFQKVSDNARKV